MYNDFLENQNTTGVSHIDSMLGTPVFVPPVKKEKQPNVKKSKTPANRKGINKKVENGDCVSCSSNGERAAANHRSTNETALLSQKSFVLTVEKQRTKRLLNSLIRSGGILENIKDNAAIAVDQLVTEYKNEVWGKYEVQRISKQILLEADTQAHKSRFNSQSKCGTKTYTNSTNANVNKTKNDKIALTNIFRCGSPWCCPSCSKKIRKAHLSNILSISRSMQSAGFVGVFATLTFPHSFDSAGVFKHASDVWRSITAQRSYKALKSKYDLHYIKALEFTYSDNNGFHPHLHILFYVKPKGGFAEIFDADAATIASDVSTNIRNLWTNANRKKGFEVYQGAQNFKPVYNNDLQNPADYITKLSASFELAQSGTKTAQAWGINPLLIPAYISEGVDMFVADPSKIYSQFAAYSKKQRSITYSKGLFDLCGIDREKEKEESLVHSTENIDSLLYAIEPKAFGVLVQKDLLKYLIVQTYHFIIDPRESIIQKVNRELQKTARSQKFKILDDVLVLERYQHFNNRNNDKVNPCPI